MKLKLVFVAATAVGLIMSAQAFADPNTLYLTQTGAGNQATVQQDAGSGGNDIANSGAHALQQGDNNRFSELQFTGGGFSGGDNDILAMKQVGDGNVFGSSYSNQHSGGDRINSFLQKGNLNWASIGRNGASSATVGTFNQTGSSNAAKIVQQSGASNTVTLLQQIGSNNGVAFGSGGPQNANQWATSILQSGSNNLVKESSIYGDNNKNNSPVNSIVQIGDYNGRTNSVARTRGSVGNFIHVSETGNWNNFNVLQGINTSSTGNQVTLTQMGSYNSGSVTQFGNDNWLTATQIGDGNTATANFSGDRNGNGAFSLFNGLHQPVLPVNAYLVQGTIYQDSTGGAGNSVTYNVTGSDNLFAMAQLGGSNSITGKVNSDSNEVAVLQTGNSNVTNFVQQGGSANAISVSQ
ncbi:hypothetical protein PSQ19_10970 [Devosia algicola]|uniref:Curlin associated repeat-containing protein n=1 Tax=Devosia algicola TaxID=3026418 RepID=A0ABY7YJI6_9HYPH|nr:hypothetical protein [Devosia algicola]WDR01348.1 hypothetical protein PSQ19_10970 [Devosia algicola]